MKKVDTFGSPVESSRFAFMHARVRAIPYFMRNQFLTDGSRMPSYWVLGIFGEKIFGKFSLFFNAENITDTRQGRFGPVVLPPHQNRPSRRYLLIRRASV
jgi:hypothetical protein